MVRWGHAIFKYKCMFWAFWGEKMLTEKFNINYLKFNVTGTKKFQFLHYFVKFLFRTMDDITGPQQCHSIWQGFQ